MNTLEMFVAVRVAQSKAKYDTLRALGFKGDDKRLQTVWNEIRREAVDMAVDGQEVGGKRVLVQETPKYIEKKRESYTTVRELRIVDIHKPKEKQNEAHAGRKP